MSSIEYDPDLQSKMFILVFVLQIIFLKPLFRIHMAMYLIQLVSFTTITTQSSELVQKLHASHFKVL